jgi:glutathione synthase
MDIADGVQRIRASGHELRIDKNALNSWTLGDEQTADLSRFDIILMRQDPPFDLAYITATHILEHLKGKTRIINDPVGVRNAPEKLLITYFPKLMPPTLISRDMKAISAFRDEHQDIIIKPLYGFGGHGIFHLRPGDDNLPALVETMAAANNEPWMIQKFLPIATLGDKRIVLLDGDIVGHYTRFPASGDMRGNQRAGGRVEASTLTSRDRDICAALKPVLMERGLFLTGIDVIGDYLTEINVTSPTGLMVSDQFAGRSDKNSIAEMFWMRVVE